MNISQLLEALKDPSMNLTVGEKLLAGFSVAILSMVVVFIVLVLISTIISLLQREKTNKPAQLIENEETDLRDQSASSDYENNEELVSVITAAISAATGNSTNNILVKKIVRSNNSKTSWESMAKNATK